jgi:hypothetical protein
MPSKPKPDRCERLLTIPEHAERPLRCLKAFTHDPPHTYDPETSGTRVREAPEASCD